eukprot:tig00001154_g7298.t1
MKRGVSSPHLHGLPGPREEPEDLLPLKEAESDPAPAPQPPPPHPSPLRRVKSYDHAYGATQRTRNRSESLRVHLLRRVASPAQELSAMLAGLPSLPRPRRKQSFVNLVMAGESLDFPENAMQATEEDVASVAGSEGEGPAASESDMELIWQERVARDQARPAAGQMRLITWEARREGPRGSGFFGGGVRAASAVGAPGLAPAARAEEREETRALEAVAAREEAAGVHGQRAVAEKAGPGRGPGNGPRVVVSRLVLRSAIYFVYEMVGRRVGKDQGRYVKLLAEWGVDEVLRPSSFSTTRKALEYLLPGLASLVCTRLYTRYEAALMGTKARREAAPLWFSAAYRAPPYYLATAAGLGFSFFDGRGAKDILRPRRWPRYFTPLQGLATLVRSVAYALIFLLPWSCIPFFRSWWRRRNVCRFSFITLFALLGALRRLAAAALPPPPPPAASAARPSERRASPPSAPPPPPSPPPLELLSPGGPDRLPLRECTIKGIRQARALTFVALSAMRMLPVVWSLCFPFFFSLFF